MAACTPAQEAAKPPLPNNTPATTPALRPTQTKNTWETLKPEQLLEMPVDNLLLCLPEISTGSTVIETIQQAIKTSESTKEADRNAKFAGSAIVFHKDTKGNITTTYFKNPGALDDSGELDGLLKIYGGDRVYFGTGAEVEKFAQKYLPALTLDADESNTVENGIGKRTRLFQVTGGKFGDGKKIGVFYRHDEIINGPDAKNLKDWYVELVTYKKDYLSTKIQKQTVEVASFDKLMASGEVLSAWDIVDDFGDMVKRGLKVVDNSSATPIEVMFPKRVQLIETTIPTPTSEVDQITDKGSAIAYMKNLPTIGTNQNLINRVKEEAMNKRLPNGAIVLFRTDEKLPILLFRDENALENLAPLEQVLLSIQHPADRFYYGTVLEADQLLGKLDTFGLITQNRIVNLVYSIEEVEEKPGKYQDVLSVNGGKDTQYYNGLRLVCERDTLIKEGKIERIWYVEYFDKINGKIEKTRIPAVEYNKNLIQGLTTGQIHTYYQQNGKLPSA